MKIYAYIIIIKLLYFNLTACANIKCNGSIIFDHYNLSESDLKAKKLDIYCGKEITVICQLDEISLQNGCLPSNLTYEFGIGDKPPAGTQFINDKALQLRMITNKPDSFTVTCLYNDRGLNSLVMTINVGREPQPIEMQCLVCLHKKQIRCEFEMSGNPVLEEYTILYSNHSTRPAIYNSAVFKMEDKIRKWATDLTTHQKFDPFGTYTFLVNGTNRFGVLMQNFTFHTQQIVVIPAAKSNKIQSLQSKSAIIEIILPATVKMYEFIYNVTACTVRCDKEKNWLQVNVTNITTNATQTDLIFNLNISLPYAYQSYKLQIRIQPKDALYPIKHQITVKSKTFKTLECPPENPPTTFMNGFEIRGDNKVIVYWKEILDMDKNGPEFKYEISEIHENDELLSTVNLTILSNSSGRLRNFDRNKSYKIRMVSRNSAGVSANRSNVIQIPKATESVAPPAQMRKTIYNNIYDLSWKVSPSLDIVNYTIYWCSSIDESQSMCGTLLGYEILPINQTIFQYYNTPKSGMKNFAIAANTKNSSSGLFWFTCSDRYMPEVTHITQSKITLNWTMPCHTTRQRHVIISYCECVPYSDTTCRTDKKIMAVMPIDKESITLSKLNQCTSYLIKIQESYANTTHPLEIKAKTTTGMPPIPMTLESGIITNTTIEISWSLSFECPNPEPMWYNITYNNLNSHIYHSNGSKSYTITNLSSFSMYDIKLAACYYNTQCSNFSKVIKIKTKYGTPAGTENLIDGVNDNGFAYYSWQPSLKNAEFQYYEVKHNVVQYGVDTELTSIVFNPKCTLVKNPCDDGIKNFKYFVRVINVDEMINNSYSVQMSDTFNPDICFEEISYSISTLCDQVKCLFGEWKEFRGFNCFPGHLIIKFSLIAVVMLGFLAGLCAGIMVGIRKYRSIKNVGHVSMPEGLDNIFKSRSNLIQKLESPSDECDEPKEEYCTYEYIFSSANRLDEISVTESVATIENHDDYLEYCCDVVPLPNPGNYVKLNDLQNQSKIPTSGYTSISALQSHMLLSHSSQQKIPNRNGYLPVSAISTNSMPMPVKMNGYVPIQMLHTMKPQVTTGSSGYTSVSALQHNPTKLQTVSTNGYITIAALQSQTS